MYSEDQIPKAEARLEYELRALSGINGGEQAFLDMIGFLRKFRNLCHGVDREYNPVISFRGGASASIIAYLTEISQYDPIEMGFDPWVFYEHARVIEFNVNLPINALRIINDFYPDVPECVVLNVNRDASVVEAAEAVMYGKNVNSVFNEVWDVDVEIQRFFEETIFEDDMQSLKYLVGFDDRYVPYVYDVISYLQKIDSLPKNLAQLARLNGFLHSDLTDDDYIGAIKVAAEISEDGNLYNNLICYSEDLFYKLLSEGCDRNTAVTLAWKVRNLKRSLGPDDLVNIVDYCGEDYMKMVSNVRHLYGESQCFQIGVSASELIFMINNHRKAAAKAYEMVCADMGI